MTIVPRLPTRPAAPAAMQVLSKTCAYVGLSEYQYRRILCRQNAGWSSPDPVPIEAASAISGTLLRQQAAAQGVGCRLSTVGGAGLGENIADMCGHCIEADVQRLDNVTIAPVGSEEAQYLQCALRDAPIDNIEGSIDHRAHIQRVMASTSFGWRDQILMGSHSVSVRSVGYDFAVIPPVYRTDATYGLLFTQPLRVGRSPSP